MAGCAVNIKRLLPALVLLLPWIVILYWPGLAPAEPLAGKMEFTRDGSPLVTAPRMSTVPSSAPMYSVRHTWVQWRQTPSWNALDVCTEELQLKVGLFDSIGGCSLPWQLPPISESRDGLECKLVAPKGNSYRDKVALGHELKHCFDGPFHDADWNLRSEYFMASKPRLRVNRQSSESIVNAPDYVKPDLLKEKRPAHYEKVLPSFGNN